MRINVISLAMVKITKYWGEGDDFLHRDNIPHFPILAGNDVIVVNFT